MKIAYVKAQNFMLYKNFNRKFEDKDIMGIICEYKGNATKSNRGGKSTIIEMILYNWFGSSRAKKETALIHHGEEMMMTETGVIDDDGNLYVIKRGRDHKNNGMLECDFLNKKKEAQEAIDELLGCNAKEFELTNFFKQSDINQFMELDHGKKKEHLMKWFKNTHWTKLFDKVSEDLREKASKLKTLRTRKETLLEDLIEPKDVKKKIKKTEVKIEKKQEALDKLIKKFKKLEKKATSSSDLEKIEEEAEAVQDEINELSEEIYTIKQANAKVAKMESELILIKEDVDQAGKYSEKEYKKALNDQAKVVQQSKEKARLLDLMESKFCGLCPILNEGCDRIEKSDKQIKQLKKEIKKLDSKCQTYEEMLDAMDDLKHLNESYKEAQMVLKSAKKNKGNTKPLKTKLKSLDAKYESLMKKINASDDDLDSELEELQEKIDERQSGLDNLNQKIGQYQSQIVRYKKAIEKVEQVDSDVEALEEEIEDLKYIAFMFGKNGIPSQEIENAFQEIEDEINFILDKMGTRMEVSFNPDRELGTWEVECGGCGYRYPKGYRRKDCVECGELRRKKRKDELHLSVIENGNETNFEQESGGGKTFISLAVRIALTALKKRQTGSNLDVLFLDEIDSALDDDAREKIMKLVTTVLMKYFGFKQIFWVSHNKRIQESVPHTLKVIRYKDYAKAKWV